MNKICRDLTTFKKAIASIHLLNLGLCRSVGTARKPLKICVDTIALKSCEIF